MNNFFLQNIFRLCCIAAGIIFISLNNLRAADNIQIFKNETDSLKNEVSKCRNDEEKFLVLVNYFWQYAEKDFERVKPIGNWAYEVIKDSRSLKVLSDGYDIKGYILERENEYDSAYVFFQKALLISKKIRYNQRIVWSYYHLARINDVQSHTDSALFYMKLFYGLNYKNQDIANAHIGLNEIASIYENHNQPDSALAYYYKMLALARHIQDNGLILNSYFAIIKFYNNQNNTKKALGYMNDALKLAEETNNSKALTTIYYQIGDLFYKQKKNYEIALVYYEKVLDICKSKNKSLEATILNDIGNLYLEEGKDSLALVNILQGLQISREIKFKHQISESYKNLGVIYKHQGKLLEAINSFKICYNTGCDKCPKIVFHSSLIDIADSYLKLNNRGKALEYYNESLKLAEESRSDKERAISDLKIGDFYRSQDSKLSEKYYLSAFHLAKQANNITLIRSVADTLCRFYMMRNNYKAAFGYQSIAMTMADSINNIDRQATMADWELKFEFERINKENEAKEQISKEEIKRQKLFRNGALLISGLLIILGSVVFSSYRRKKKDNMLLTAQKNEIEQISHELHESDEMKLRFFSNISHEFRTPLTLVINPVENLLKTFTGNGESRKQLEFICKNAHKLLDLTNQLMDLQKLDADKLQLNLEKADIIEYCLGIVSSFESLCYKKNNAITFTANHRAVFGLFDKDKIGKILTNLISNAFKFCYENSAIEIIINVSENSFNLSITDKGIGISGEQINNVFKRYYQVPSDNHVTGTGIGLAYVKELIGFMNGKVTIESELKIGTLVTISIPIDEVVIKNIAEYRIIIPNNGKRSNRKEFDAAGFIMDDQNESTVLLVEDNDELRTFIAGLLKSEFNVRLAQDGREGLQAAIQHIPDIIISDVMMPVMSGIELCATLKKDEHTSHIPVILLTAKDSAQSSLEGYQTGADDYIIKPFDNELLKLKVRNIITTREAARKQFDFKSILSIDGLKLGQTDKEFMRKCLAVIEKYIDNSEFAVDKLAGELAFSNRNFYRKIKALTNQTPAELIRIYRLHHARKLLQNTQMKVFEIAMAVGYEDTNKFRQAFKKQFGVSPSESINKMSV